MGGEEVCGVGDGEVVRWRSWEAQKTAQSLCGGRKDLCKYGIPIARAALQYLPSENSAHYRSSTF